MVPKMTWCDKFSLSCRNEFRFEYHQAYPTISTSRLHSWMWIRARVLTPLHEDEMWMVQAKAFLSPAPLVAGPSAESRGLDSTQGAVPIRFCSASSPKQDALSEEIAEKSNAR